MNNGSEYLVNMGGIPPMNNSMGTVTFNRTNSFVGAALPFKIIIDGQEVGKIKKGQTLTFNVTYGTHNLQLVFGFHKVDSTIVIGDNSRNLVFKCYVGWGFFQGHVKLELINYYNKLNMYGKNI